MKILIYSQEDLDLILSLKTEEKDKEILEMKRRINDLIKDNTEYKLENLRLNNIINELETWINNVKKFDDICAYEDYSGRFGIQPKFILDKLKELKESGNNE